MKRYALPLFGQGIDQMQKKTLNVIVAIVIGLMALGLYLSTLLILTTQ